jgi:MFS transporter, DHA1 family, tetracycline resistance protein
MVKNLTPVAYKKYGLSIMQNKKTKQQISSKIKIILPLCMVIFIDTCAMTLVYPLFAPLFSLDASSGGFFSQNVSLQNRDLLYGLVMAIYPIFMFFTSPLLGNLSDKIGRKKVLLICLLGASIAAFFSGIAIVIHSFSLFFLSRIVAGGVAGSMPVAQAAITDISDKRDKTTNISLIGFAYTLGVVLGPVLGGFLSNKNIVSWFSFATPFFITTLLSFGNALILGLTFKETLSKIATQIKLKSIQIWQPLLMFARAYQNKIIYKIMLTCFFYVLSWNVYLQFTALNLFQNYQFNAMQIGYFVSWIAIIMSLTMLLIIRVMVKFFSTTQILYIAIALTIAGILLCMIHSVTMQWLSAIPIACGTGLAFATIVTLFSNAVKASLQGWIMGVSNAVMSAAAGSGGLLLGIVSSSDKITFITIIGSLVLCMAFALRVVHKQVKKP